MRSSWSTWYYVGGYIVCIVVGQAVGKRSTKRPTTQIKGDPNPSTSSRQPHTHSTTPGPLNFSTKSEEFSARPFQQSCRLQVPDAKNILLSFENNTPLKGVAADVNIPHGMTLLARCPALGTMKLLGVSSIQCNNGKWSNRLPTCLPTTPADGLSPFIDDHPPTILTHIPAGSAGESAAGELVVRPNSNVHLDCIFYRKLGKPSWFWTNSGQFTKNYPTGWSIIRNERLWHYRLSIFSIQARDEGTYTCATPLGHSNSIRIAVQTIECPTFNQVNLPLKAAVQGNYVGQSVTFSCLDGYHLEGPRNTTCLASGTWSEPRLPHCTMIQCSYDIDGADPRLEFDFLNGVGFNAMIKFSCPSGYQLKGPSNATCREDMIWNPPPPICEAIKCEELLPPLNGRIVDSAGSHFVGDIVKFSCNRNFLLVGQVDIVCTDDGSWSHSSPQCQLACPHPGHPSFGYITPNSTATGYYEIGATIQVLCLPQYTLIGRPWLVCQQDGIWSSTVGKCLKD